MSRLPAYRATIRPLTLRGTLCVLAAALAATPAFAAGDLEAGRKKARMCQVCHGLDGIGKNPDVPNLAGESPQYITRQLKAFRSGERTHAQMSIIAKGLSDEDIANVATYYSKIKVEVTLP
ncbi:cytochrome c [Breoghania sp. L-A4]|uniref:c-type cytochrome n=1 Tax=Breoghania sp. L-A4 TaxID=2304600 RepID=UPI000E35CEBF|nr:cytochrome c [Breoghania sp. L-A4]AXS41352.1 cytochrome c [Breoghania sp. L-A4]